MNKRLLSIIIISLCCFKITPASAAILKKDDYRSRELKYQYNVLKDDEKDKLEGKILNIYPSGYMTVEEYEALSEYKDKSNFQPDIPKIKTPSDFKYVPKPLYRITKYNDPPGSVELSLGKRLYAQKQINAQGIVSPDYSIMVYPAIYYYSDSVSVASDLFVIPLNTEGDTTLNNILKANTAQKIPEPILSTDKAIDNYAAFRTLTPVDFSSDGTKLLVKQKIGSSEDGIWQTVPFVYDFKNKLSYELSEVRDAIVYFWNEYMDINLDNVRWDITPLGFDLSSPDRIIVQGYAYTGEKPVFLGTWSVDWQGNQSRIVSFDKNLKPAVSINGFKVIQDGVGDYTTAQQEEKSLKKETKVIKKAYKEQYEQLVNQYEDEYKFSVRGLKDDYKEEYRDYKKLRSLTGSTEDAQLQAAYKKYLIDQYNKDVKKAEKKIEKQKKDIEKIDKKLDKLYEQTGDSSKSNLVPEDETTQKTSDENENSDTTTN